MRGIVDEGRWAGIHAGVVIDVVAVDALLALQHGADIAEIGTGDAGEGVGVGGDGALLQALVVVEEGVGRERAVEALLAYQHSRQLYCLISADVAALDGLADVLDGH